MEKEWEENFSAYQQAYPELAERLQRALKRELPPGWDDDIPTFTSSDGPMATRVASGKVLNSFAPKRPWLLGGSADLAPSTKTLIDDARYFSKEHYEKRNIEALAHYDPANLDREMLDELVLLSEAERALREVGLKGDIQASAPTTEGVIATLDGMAIAGQRVAVRVV